MIVTQNNCGGKSVYRLFEDDPGINHRTGYSTLADPDLIEDPVGTIQKQDPEFLMLQICK
jgi:hypothetical protein